MASPTAAAERTENNTPRRHCRVPGHPFARLTTVGLFTTRAARLEQKTVALGKSDATIKVKEGTRVAIMPYLLA